MAEAMVSTRAMKITSVSGIFSIIGAVVLAASAYGQATITWGTAQQISGDTDVVTTGSLVAAYNLGDTGVTSTTVNGVTFAPYVFPQYPAQSVTLGNYAFVEDPDYLLSTDSAGYGSGAFAALSSEYKSLLVGFGGAGLPVTLTLTISGLTAGHEYLFEWWNNYSGSTSSNFDTTATAGDSLSLDANVGNVQGNLGQYGIGTFTASGTTEDIAFTGSFGPAISAFQLRETTAVPEPSSYAMIAGLAVLGLVFLRRRKARTA